MAEWNETVLWTQAQISNYFQGREEEREEGEIWFSLYVILSVTVCKAKIDAQSHNPASCSLWLYWFQVRVQHYLELWGWTNLKVIMIKYFLSQLELLFWLQHPATWDSVWNKVSDPYRQPLNHLLLLVYILPFLASVWKAVERQVFSPTFYVANPYPKWRKGQTRG